MHNNAPTEYEQQTVIEDKIEGLKDEKKSDNWKRWQKN